MLNVRVVRRVRSRLELERLAIPRFKLIKTGQAIYEFYAYERSFGFDPISGKKYKVVRSQCEREAEPYTLSKHFEKLKRNISRARNQFRRLVGANFTSGDWFVTLTFRENVTDINRALKLWKAYARKIKQRYGELRYIGVIEFQRRGAIHFHIIANITLPVKHELGLLWGHGWVDVRRLSDKAGKTVDNVGAYMCKYLTKNAKDERLLGRKAYFTSQGLLRPETYTGMEALEQVEALGLEHKFPVYGNFYTGEYTGEVRYLEYNLVRWNIDVPCTKSADN